MSLRTLGARLVGEGGLLNFVSQEKIARRVFLIAIAESGADINVEGVAVAAVIVLTLRV